MIMMGKSIRQTWVNVVSVLPGAATESDRMKKIFLTVLHFFSLRFSECIYRITATWQKRIYHLQGFYLDQNAYIKSEIAACMLTIKIKQQFAYEIF